MLDRKLKLEDLEVGMKIRDKSQLSDIYDMWVILTKAPDESYYTIGFFGKETNEQSDKLFNTGNKANSWR